jgi:ATP phosphoribosyltransferase regulatory subunit
VGAAFGRARAATGFSLDLRELVELRELGRPTIPTRIITAPWSDDPALAEVIRGLRAAGEIVMQLLPGQTDHGPDQHIDRMIEMEDGRWQVRQCTERDTSER